MVDVFLSFASADNSRSKRIHQTLLTSGCSVSAIDESLAHAPLRIQAAVDLARKRGEDLRNAKCVVVLWSKAAIRRKVVIADAEQGQTRGVLVQATLDGVRPPQRFSDFPLVDLSKEGDTNTQAVYGLAAAAKRVARGSKKAIQRGTSGTVPSPDFAPLDAGDSQAKEGSPESKPRAKPQTHDARRRPRVFLSYRRDDAQGEAGRLNDRLVDAFGTDSVFMDVDSVPIGIDFVDYIDEQLAECAVMVAVIGPGWSAAVDESGRRRLDDPEDLVRVEIAAALNRKIPVIPILVRAASMPRKESLPEDLRPLSRRNGLEVSHQRWRQDVDRLVDAIRGFLENTGSRL